MASQCSAIELPVTVTLKGVKAGPGFTQELRDTAEAMWNLADKLDAPGRVSRRSATIVRLEGPVQRPDGGDEPADADLEFANRLRIILNQITAEGRAILTGGTTLATFKVGAYTVQMDDSTSPRWAVRQ